jgi:tight adherence protein B
MMARSLRAGHAISGALELVATEMPRPVGLEFARVFEEQRLGLPLEEAIVHMTKRLPANRDVKIVAVSVIIQRETGGNMAEILTGIAETIRARYRFEGKLRGITAEGRASALVLGLLPLAFAALLQFIHPRYLDPLFDSPTGRLALGYAIVSWGLGLLVLHRMAKVEF